MSAVDEVEQVDRPMYFMDHVDTPDIPDENALLFEPTLEPIRQKDSSSSLLESIIQKIGHIDESRLASPPEYRNGDVPKLFSNLKYTYSHSSPHDGNSTQVLIAQPASSSTFSSALLLTGTALGSGILFLPSAIATTGYLPSLPATLVAYGYMTVSSLLTAELLINRCGETGRVGNTGLLELYSCYLGKKAGSVASVVFIVAAYVMVGVYFGAGGDGLGLLADATSASVLTDAITTSSITSATTTTSATMAETTNWNSALHQTIFASSLAIFLATASKFGKVQKVMTNILVPITLLAFTLTIGLAIPTADFHALVNSSNQHPELVLNAFPLLFMSWSNHAVIPRVVYDLEGDEMKIKRSIWGGSTVALVLYLVWNAVLLANGSASADTTVGADLINYEPIHNVLVHNPDLTIPIALVTELAIITSLIGTILGFVNEFYDAMGASNSSSPSYGPRIQNKWQVALLTLSPSVVFSILLAYYQSTLNLDRYQIMEYTGAFGASTLFLILPAYMVWQNRYGEDGRPLTVKPMFPLGKITLGSLYKAAGTLIVEQGLEKLGVFEFLREQWLLLTSSS